MIEDIGRKYGDVIYDLCEGFLKDSSHAQSAYQLILKEINRRLKGPRFEKYEQEWILGIAVEQLRLLFPKQGKTLSAEDQITLDSTAGLENRLARFPLFLDYLHYDERLVLLLKDKLGLSYESIAACVGLPVESVKLRRTQALRVLETSIWSGS